MGVCAVLVGLELVYIPDRFTGELARYNTYFKLSFPIWPPLIVATWLAAWRVWRYPRPWGPGGGARLRQRAAGWAGRAALLAILAASGVYAVLAIPARVIQARRGDLTPRGPTLDAFAFVAHRPPYGIEAPLLAWIRRHVPPGDVVVEAPLTEPGSPWTKAYDYGGRAASLAGHPVPTAWAHHEHQWRGEPAYALTARRTEAVDAFYRAPTPEAMGQWMDRMGYRWALFGVVERARYGEEPLGRLNAAAATAARFPDGRPEVFLFDFATQKAPTGFSPPWNIGPKAP
jgi:uncharacterized membrane protein